MTIISFGLPSCAPWKLESLVQKTQLVPISPESMQRNNCGVKAFFFNPTKERILKEAIAEPVAFMGGMFAGLLRLDLSEDPLKEWVARTMEASGIAEEVDAEKVDPEESPQQIEIE